MSWLASIIVGVLTAAIAAVATGVVASLAVDWYGVPSREGASGYFVIAFILLALIVGLIIGISVSRTIAGRPDPGFLKAFGWSQLIALGLVAVIGAFARLMADVPPTLGGQTLLVNVEFRWPEGVALPDTVPGEWALRLSTLSGTTQRLSETGPLWKEDARLEGGRWIVPGAVQLYTSRGKRLVAADPDGIMPTAFLVSIPAWPGRRTLEWSAWFPQLRPGTPPIPGGITYRWRLVPADQVIRSEAVGPFTVQTRASSFSQVTRQDQRATWSAAASFTIAIGGQPVAVEGTTADGESVRATSVDAVAVIGGASPALLVVTEASRGSGNAWLLTADGTTVRTTYVGYVSLWLAAPPLTSDTAVFAAARGYQPIDGRIDRTGFARPGIYLFDGATLDTRTLTVHRFAPQGEAASELIDRIPPLGVSPDGQSFVRVSNHITGGYSDGYSFVVTNMQTGVTDTLPIHAGQMRFKDIDQLSPLYVNHYFTWQRGPDGSDHLVPHRGVTPLPWRGVLSDISDSREYRVGPAQQSLLEPVVEIVQKEFNGQRLPLEQYSSTVRLVIQSDTVNIMWSEGSDAHVGIWMERNRESHLMDDIAQRVDAALATGKYDAHFVTEPAP